MNGAVLLRLGEGEAGVVNLVGLGIKFKKLTGLLYATEDSTTRGNGLLRLAMVESEAIGKKLPKLL